MKDGWVIIKSLQGDSRDGLSHWGEGVIIAAFL
jgi:hypothetical protein